LNAEHREAIERHEVPFELLNAASRLSSTSPCSLFKRYCAAFKSIIFHKLILDTIAEKFK
jgi:hypothetical protein